MRLCARAGAALLSIGLSGAAAGCSSPLSAWPWTRVQERVLVISIDGYGPAGLRGLRAATPNLDRLRAHGISGTARTVFPSMTWPAHATLLTGKSPAEHGVVGNAWFDRETRSQVRAWSLDRDVAIRTPTIFEYLKERREASAAAVLWPLTNRASSVDFNVPEAYHEAFYAEIVAPETQREITENVAPFRNFGVYSYSEDLQLDALVRDTTAYLIRRRQPNLLLAHFVSFDTRQHRFGPRDRRAREALEFIDQCVGSLLAALDASGLRERTTIFVVSDHGFFDIKRGVDLNIFLQSRGLIRNPLRPNLNAERVWTVSNGHSAHVYLLDQAAGLHNQTRAALRASPGVERVFEPGEYAGLGLPTPEENPAVGDFIALLHPQLSYTTLPGRRYLRTYREFGMHGYLPEHPDNQTHFIASGAGVSPRDADLHVDLRNFAPAVLRRFGIEAGGLDPGELAGPIEFWSETRAAP